MTEGATLTREQILEVQDHKIERVEVPEWGGSVLVRSMTGTERDLFEASIVNMGANGKSKMNFRLFRARLAASTMIDEEGNRLFSDLDVETLGHKNAAALQRVVDVAMKLSGISDSDVEELVGNSGSAQSDGSGSDSA